MDLTNPANATLIDTNAQELTGDWRGYTLRGPKASVKGPIGKAPTQEFGEQLYASQPSAQGILTISACVAYHRTLVVFPTRLVKGTDFVSYSYPDTAGNMVTAQIP